MKFIGSEAELPEWVLDIVNETVSLEEGKDFIPVAPSWRIWGGLKLGRLTPVYIGDV